MRCKRLFLLLEPRGGGVPPGALDRIPRAFLADPENEVLVVVGPGPSPAPHERPAASLAGRSRVTILHSPVALGYGECQKLGYRYAIEERFDRVLLVPDGAAPGAEAWEQLDRPFSTEPRPDAVVEAPAERPAGMRAYSTALLERIPFERNSNDSRFDAELALQCRGLDARIVEVVARARPLPLRRAPVSAAKFWFHVTLSSLHHRLQRMGFLYDRKFDLGAHDYPFKPSPYSSHSRLVGSIRPGSRVLDIGCGEGWLAQALLAKGCTVDGVDRVPAEKIRFPLRHYRQVDLNQDLGPLRALLAENAYDYIVLADILEHLVEPEAFLDTVRASSTSPNGAEILASTGNVAFLLVRAMLALGQFNYGPRGILDRTHTRLFTKRSFRRLFEQSGYRVQEIGGIPLPFCSILNGSGGFPLLCEKLNGALTKLSLGLFSYQLFVRALSLPTANQLLTACKRYSPGDTLSLPAPGTVPGHGEARVAQE